MATVWKSGGIRYTLMILCAWNLDVCSSGTSVAGEKAMTVASLAEANDQTISSITSLVINIRSEIEAQGANPIARCLSFECRWIWQKDQMRLVQEVGPGGTQLFHKDAKMTPKSAFRDTYNGREGYRCLMSYDPHKPPVISATAPGGAGGLVGKECANPYSAVYPQRILLFELPYKTGSVRLVSLTKERLCRVTATPQSSANKCYDIEMVNEHDNIIVVSLDPRNGFMIKQLECRKKDGRLLYDSSVTSFHEVSDSIRIPKQIIRHIYEEGDSTANRSVLTTYTTATVTSVNQDIPNDEFRVRFPPWLSVVDRDTNRLYLWGEEDGKPFREFGSIAEYTKWYVKLTGRDLPEEAK